MWNLIKYDTKQQIYKTETNSQISRPNLMVPIGETVGEGKNWEGGNNTYTLLYKIDDLREPTLPHRKIYLTVGNNLCGKKEWIDLYV